jgi:hypothetical protein
MATKEIAGSVPAFIEVRPHLLGNGECPHLFVVVLVVVIIVVFDA